MLKFISILTLTLYSSLGFALDYSEISNPLESGLKDRELQDYLLYNMKKDQIEIRYSDVREHLFTNVDLEVDNDGNFFITDVYCEQVLSLGAGTVTIPKRRNVNIEHTWPQSRFNKLLSKDLQKGDLHHLFISNRKANSERGNLPFAETAGRGADDGKCPESRIGKMTNQPIDMSPRRNQDFFQPPFDHRGNVARALFYFATRYDLKIKSDQEYFLRKWHKEDPVDTKEILRNEKIEKVQRNRNLFIDYPELVDQISDF